MPGVRAEIDLSIEAQDAAVVDLGRKTMTLRPVREVMQFLPGTDEVNQLDILFSDTRTLAASASEDLDLAGVLQSSIGGTITMAQAVMIFVKASAANTNDVRVTRPASNGVPLFLAGGDGVGIAPGEWQLFASQKGWDVEAGTADLITIANGGAGTAVTYDIVVFGRTVPVDVTPIPGGFLTSQYLVLLFEDF